LPGQYGAKLLIALMDTPFIYTVKKLSISPVKRHDTKNRYIIKEGSIIADYD
jgi:uncharacterized PurR-regulated membrane protein YhhQ (DUF165 family)